MNDDINEGQIITAGLQHRPYRYKACTLDGSIIYQADTAQEISDAVCTHIAEDRRPYIGYTHDVTPNYGYPFTTWRAGPNGGVVSWIGTPHKTFKEVCEWWILNNKNS